MKLKWHPKNSKGAIPNFLPNINELVPIRNKNNQTQIRNKGINSPLIKTFTKIPSPTRNNIYNSTPVRNNAVNKEGKPQKKIPSTPAPEYEKLGPFDVALLRGMASYAVIWPTCSLINEYLVDGTTVSNADWCRAFRYGIFGTFFMAPVFHTWMKFSSRFFKPRDFKTAFTRAAVEQVTYGPVALSYFFFGMSLLEGKCFDECVNEVREKFWPTYKIGFFYWPTVQTLNFYFVPVSHRLLIVSFASLVWTVFMAHMKSQPQKNRPRSESGSRSRRESN